MNYITIYILGAINAILGVVIGAFGAHALKDKLLETGYGDQFETGSKYHFYHAFGLFITGFLAQTLQLKFTNIAAYLFALGIVLFSGSLYLLGITGIRKLGMITPLGGLCFIAGWSFLLLGLIKK